MSAATKKAASPAMVVIAFATVYLVWGSTYFFIQKAIQHIPAFTMGAMRFLTAGLILFAWCVIKKEKLFGWQQIKPAIISGIILLFAGNGTVIWAEQTLPSSLVAVLVSSSPMWFVVLDKPNWKQNFSSREIIAGLTIGFAGVIILFGERISASLSHGGGFHQVAGFLVLVIGAMSWAGGSLYSKYNSRSTAIVNTTWQMIAAGIAFILAALINKEWQGFHPAQVTPASWFSVVYLVLMGSLAGYSAYVWLLQVRPATQVSTHAYVNPVVAVLLGVLFAGESMSWVQVAGLAIILVSVLLINIAKQRKDKATVKQRQQAAMPGNAASLAAGSK